MNRKGSTTVYCLKVSLRKKVADEKIAEEKAAQGKGLLAMLVPASTLKPGAKRKT